MPDEEEDEGHGTADTTMVAWVCDCDTHRTDVDVVVACDGPCWGQSQQPMDDEHGVAVVGTDDTWYGPQWMHIRDPSPLWMTNVPIEAFGWQSPDDLLREHDLPFVSLCLQGVARKKVSQYLG